MNKRHWFRRIVRRRIIVAFLLILQVAFIVPVLTSDHPAIGCLSAVLRAIGICLAVYVIYRPEETSSATFWIFLLLLFPVAGSLLYLLIRLQSSSRLIAKHINRANARAGYLPELCENTLSQACDNYPQYTNQFRYLMNHAGYPIYNGTSVRYLSPGESFMPVFLEALENAERYIFLEYFIIGEGEMWEQILAVLKRKAKQGVDVRVIFDDIGCFVTLPKNYARTLEGFGIKCAVFNPFRPILTTIQNNRDHRKIACIDGKTAFTGGINLSDEYINLYPKHGYWKDSAVRIEGKAVRSFTVMFLRMWSICRPDDESYEGFFIDKDASLPDDGFVQPYADSPVSRENVGEQVYLQIINSAKDYLYITTPYLIIDDKMVHALTSAAKSGVDVRIITPHIFDKAAVRAATRSFYECLIREGVRIYEYTPGFIHSKLFIADDSIAAVGTVNLDYRSLFLHFECGALLCGSSAVQDIKQDISDILAASRELTAGSCRTSAPVRLFRMMLRLFAPLL